VVEPVAAVSESEKAVWRDLRDNLVGLVERNRFL